MKKILGIALGILLIAQSVASNDIVIETDAQFYASQKARSEGLAAFRTGNHALALTHMEAALKYRPGNTLLLGYVAFLAAETGNLERAEEATLSLMAAGQTPGTAIQKKLAEKLDENLWEELKTKLNANNRPKGTPLKHATIPNDVHLIEGIAVTADGRTFVSSVVSAGLYTLSDKEASLLASAKAHNMGSFFGIAYSAKNDSLFATYARVEQSPSGPINEGKTGVAEFDAATGVLKNNWALEGSTDEHQIADIIITQNHDIYVSDATGKAVYKINNHALVKAFNLPSAMSPQGLAELNNKLYLADYGRGIWLLDTKDNSVTLVGRPKTSNLSGIDGLTAHRGKLVAIQNGTNPQKIISLTLSKEENTILAINILAQSLPNFDEPTLGTSTVNGYYFVANSQWPKFGKNGTLKEGAVPKPTKLMKLP